MLIFIRIQRDFLDDIFNIPRLQFSRTLYDLDQNYCCNQPSRHNILPSETFLGWRKKFSPFFFHPCSNRQIYVNLGLRKGGDGGIICGELKIERLPCPTYFIHIHCCILNYENLIQFVLTRIKRAHVHINVMLLFSLGCMSSWNWSLG